MKDRCGDREGLRWGDVDLSAGLIRLTDSKTGAQTRVIGQAAIRRLESARPEMVEELDPVCPGTRPCQPFIGIDKVRVRIHRAAGLAGLPGVDLHSLRHTFASVGAHVHNGHYAAFVSALPGHGYTRKAIAERYIHADPEALRPAADAIAEAIATALGPSGTGRLLAFRA